MKTRVLIIGSGLSGLTTAYCLTQHGCDVSLVELTPPNGSYSSNFSASPTSEQIFPSPSSENTKPDVSLPSIIYGFHSATWSLLKELETFSLVQSCRPTQLEFLAKHQSPVRFHTMTAPPPFHTLIGLLLFRGLPWKDRWSLLKLLEQWWEGETEQPQDLDRQSVSSWLMAIGQSEKAQIDVWTPLCRLTLGIDPQKASAKDFKDFLTSCFLSKRKHSHIVAPIFNEATLFHTPLQHYLLAHNTTFHSNQPTASFQCPSQEIEGVKLHDGTILTADVYVSALPQKVLMTGLPERLLAKFAYFSNLSQLTTVPALAVNLEIPYKATPSRLLLPNDTFHWVLVQPHATHDAPKIRITCIATDNYDLLHQTDSAIIEQTVKVLARVLPEMSQSLHGENVAHILRRPHAYLSCQPNISSFRPVQQSPVPNFFVVGPWTDTGLPPSWESSIVSATSCAQAIADSQNLPPVVPQ